MLEPVLDRAERRRFAETSAIASSSDWISAWAFAVVEVGRERRHASRQVGEAAALAERAVVPPLVAFVSELSIATETVWLAFAPTWNEAEEEPAAVTIVSFARRRQVGDQVRDRAVAPRSRSGSA